jgi:hypothetical protein
VDAGLVGRGSVRSRTRESFVRTARAGPDARMCRLRVGPQIRAKEEEYVTFVRILTLMCRFASISAGKAAIFVTLYRGATLDHQGVIRCDAARQIKNRKASHSVCAE